ncbi:MAG: hypothetical protein V4719_00870 [Planctomycetota bacterium]
MPREDEYGICLAMADDRDVPDRERVPHKARTSIARSAMAFVRYHGKDYPDKASALAEFKRQLEEDKKAQTPCARADHTSVAGVGILTTIFVSIACYFFERWWSRTFPNG